MTVDIAPSSFISSAAGREAAAAPARSHLGLLARCGAWLHGRHNAALLHEIEPRMARDIGVVPGCDRRPEGFAADPRPLWGIGLTPRPMDVAPPWAGGRRGG